MRSSSVSPGGRRIGRARTAGGMTSKSSSTDAIPSAASIRDRSSGVCGPYTIGSALRGERLVGGRVEQLPELGWVGKPDPQHPAGAVWVAVHDFRGGREPGIALQDLAGDGREEVAHRLHRLDDAERRELLQPLAGFRQLDEDDVAELVGGMLGDPDRCDVALHADPLVLFRVVQIRRDHRRGNLRADAVAAARTWRRPLPRMAAGRVIGPWSRTGAGPPPRRPVPRGSPRRASYPPWRRPGRRRPSRWARRESATGFRT